MPYLAADTLRVDSVLLQQLQDDGRYDYSRDLLQVDRESLWEWLLRYIDRWLDGFFHSDQMVSTGRWLWPTIGAVLVLLVAIFIYWRRRTLFGSAGKGDPTMDADGEDTIYGIDFAQAIAEARRQERWNEVVRLTYLQTLKTLSDTERIDWRPYKTPTQYLREVSGEDFAVFTNHFLRVRYGGFAATETLCNEMTRLGEAIEKGGAA